MAIEGNIKEIKWRLFYLLLYNIGLIITVDEFQVELLWHFLRWENREVIWTGEEIEIWIIGLCNLIYIYGAWRNFINKGKRKEEIFIDWRYSYLTLEIYNDKVFFPKMISTMEMEIKKIKLESSTYEVAKTLYLSESLCILFWIIYINIVRKWKRRSYILGLVFEDFWIYFLLIPLTEYIIWKDS